MDNNLRGLVYVSDARVSFSAEELEALYTRSAVSNNRIDITGYLYYENRKFLQYIEGEPGQLEILIKKIEEDPRHEVLYILRTDELEKRKFPKWDMQWLTRPMLVSIRMENILAEFILMLKKETVQRSLENEAKVWEMIDRISRFNFQV